VYQCYNSFLYDVRVLQSNYIPTCSVYYYGTAACLATKRLHSRVSPNYCGLHFIHNDTRGFDLTERKSDQFRYTCSSSSSRQSGAGKSALNEVSAFPLYRVPLFTVFIVNLMCTRRSICHYYTVCLS